MDPGASPLSSDTSYYSNDGEEWTEFYYDSPIWTDCSIQAVPAVATTENFVVMFLIEMDISLPLAKAFITPKTVLNGQTPGTTEVMMLLHSVGISWLQYPGRERSPSSNGNEWTQSNHGISGLSEIDVIYGESGFLISGIDYGTNSYETTDDTCHLATSSDGISWQSRSFTGCNTSQEPCISVEQDFGRFPRWRAFVIGEPEGQATESEQLLFKVNLGFAPSSSVSIPVTANDSNVGIVSPSQLTFSPSD